MRKRYVCVLNKSQDESWNKAYNKLHTLFRYIHFFLCRSPNPQEELDLTLCQHSPGMPSRTLCGPSGTGVPWGKAIFSQRKRSKRIQIAQTCSGENLALCLEGSWETQLTGWVRVASFLIWERFSNKWHRLCGGSNKTLAGLSRSFAGTHALVSRDWLTHCSPSQHTNHGSPLPTLPPRPWSRQNCCLLWPQEHSWREACKETNQGCSTARWQPTKDFCGVLGSCRDLTFQHLTFGMKPHLVTLLKLISSIWTPGLACAPPLFTLPRLQGVTAGPLSHYHLQTTKHQKMLSHMAPWGRHCHSLKMV